MSSQSIVSAKKPYLEWAAVLARWVLGLLFVYMGMSKALHPVDFLKLVRQYEMVDAPWLLNFVAATLPWFEVFCGLLLATGIAVRSSALVLLLMLIPFTWTVFKRALAIHATQGIPFCQIRFDCGCGAGVVLICAKLVENSVLILLSGLLLSGRGKKWCARYGLFKG